MKVSVIIPFYKGEKYIPHLLHMMQENARTADLEVIFVNDSPAECQLDADRLRKAYQVPETLEIKAVNHKTNQGIHAARATGLTYAMGEYVLFLDQDDTITGNAVSRLCAGVVEKDKPDVLVAGGFRRKQVQQAQGRIYTKQPIYKKKAILKEVERETYYLYGTDLILSPGQCLIKKASIPAVWKEKTLTVNGCDDFLLWLLLFEKKCRFAVVSDAVYVHEEDDTNYSASYAAMERSFYAMCTYLEEISYPAKKIALLRRRYHLKTQMKSGQNWAGKIINAMKNIDIIYYTVQYKHKGYD